MSTNNRVKFKYGSYQDYIEAVENQKIDDSTIYFVSKNVDNDEQDGIDFGGGIYKGNDALGTTLADELKLTNDVNILEKTFTIGDSVQEVINELSETINNNTLTWEEI